MSRRLLVVADLGHATPRMQGICEFLPQCGWVPTIMTPRMSARQREYFLLDSGQRLEIAETQRFAMEYGARRTIAGRAMRKLKGLCGAVLQGKDHRYPDGHVAWKRHALALARVLHARDAFDAILSTSSPVTCHVIAAELARTFGVPWVADLRDLWTQNHNYLHGEERRTRERALEVETLAAASAITTVTQQLCAKLADLHGKRVYCVPNGFYPRDTAIARGQAGPLRIVYTGSIYPRFQNASLVIDALGRLNIRRGDPPPMILELYGSSGVHVARQYASAGRDLPPFVVACGEVPRARAYAVQAEADVLLLLNWEDRHEKGVATTKLLEYLATGRPILATGGFGGDFVEDLLARSGAGYYCRTVESVVERLQAVERDIARHGDARTSRDENVIRQYAYPFLAGQFARVLDQATDAGQGCRGQPMGPAASAGRR